MARETGASPMMQHGWRAGISAAGARALVARTVLLGVILVTAGCPQSVRPYMVAPRVLPTAPTLHQVIDAVQRQTASVQSLRTDDATLQLPGVPPLRATLVVERPRRLRLQASTLITGAELDVGINEELFWLWMRQNPDPYIYFCRHEQFCDSAARNLLPVEPEWLLSALGLVTFAPEAEHAGPYTGHQGTLEIRSRQQSACGLLYRLIVIDAATALVLQQHLYNEQGLRLASAVASGHRRDPASGVWLPGNVEISAPGTQLNLSIDLGRVRVNEPIPLANQPWTMPSVPGWTPLNLADPNIQWQQSPTPAPAIYPERRPGPTAQRSPIVLSPMPRKY